jgi:hypothetical protein
MCFHGKAKEEDGQTTEGAERQAFGDRDFKNDFG